MPDLSDPELVAHAQGGNVDAIEALYDRHRPSIFRYVWSRVGDRHAAEDLTSDVFVRMVTALPDYRSTGQPFRAWLYRIAHNLLVDHYRRENKHVAVSLDTIEERDAGGEDPVSFTERRLNAERVQHALSQLDPAHREIVVLRFLCELSLQEVAQVLGKTEAAVKSLQHRSLTALRQAFAREQVAL
jgi:RNA polymerase sigma-70 factor (ECF subfamily)